ncbi:MAG: hypothetical protein ACP5OG_02000 [Candidatus Nanoarchaeia archaeon]
MKRGKNIFKNNDSIKWYFFVIGILIYAIAVLSIYLIFYNNEKEEGLGGSFASLSLFQNTRGLIIYAYPEKEEIILFSTSYKNFSVLLKNQETYKSQAWNLDGIVVKVNTSSLELSNLSIGEHNLRYEVISQSGKDEFGWKIIVEDDEYIKKHIVDPKVTVIITIIIILLLVLFCFLWIVHNKKNKISSDVVLEKPLEKLIKDAKTLKNAKNEKKEFYKTQLNKKV